MNTFSNVLIHPKSSREWGWQTNYVLILQNEHLFSTIPAFDLAVWLYRTKNWPPNTKPIAILDTFFADFQINSEEKLLFTTSVDTSHIPENQLFHTQSIQNNTLLSIIGEPTTSTQPIRIREVVRTIPSPKTKNKAQIPLPNAMLAEYGAKLQYLQLSEVGPAKQFELHLAPRLNVITGDNALGKTFLLECAWGARHIVAPRIDRRKERG